jgi:N-acetyl-anhydromuramyl-L-alanine amidase AmpD
MSLSLRRGLVLACAVPLLATTAACAEVDALEGGRRDIRGGSVSRQQQFAAAAQEFGVPESVLLAVSYLESRWEAHAGQPSRAAGYGPMHLTDASWLGIDSHHSHGEEDARGDDARPAPLSRWMRSEPIAMAPALHTIDIAAELTGATAATLRSDPAENIRGGAALLARYQRELTGEVSADPASWYGAVARYAGATDAGTARHFADEVYALIASGMARTTRDGHPMTLSARPEVQPNRSQLGGLGLSMVSLKGEDEVECPDDLGCEWIPAPYQALNGGGYGNHDLAKRPDDQKVRYIIIHDTEADYNLTLSLVQNPTYVSWHYSLRSSDGHIAQHVKTKDVGWHAGNWYVNAKSIGLEHEGFAAKGTWYTEAMYRTSAKLVRYLAERYDVPLDRAHILGHDNIPGITPAKVGTMHWDPGPYWDWAHYFDLLQAPFQETGGAHAGLVTIKPDFASNQPEFIGCDAAKPADPCPAQGSTSVILHTAPSEHSPLLQDIGLHPDGSPSTMRIWDIGSRVDTGQQYAVADRSGDWTAIWYLGQKGWFYDPPSAPNAVGASGWVVTPKPGKKAVSVYGRAYPEAAAYPATVPVQAIVPLQYQLLAGQRYAVGLAPEAEYYRAVTLDPTKHVVVSGALQYYQIQFGHRVMYVMADDVLLLPSWEAAP